MENEEVTVVNNKSLGTYSNTRAKMINNPIGAIAGGAIAWYLTKKYTGIESTWAYAGIIILGVYSGANAMSYIKRSINNLKD